MKNDYTQKKAWVSPALEEAPVQITEKISFFRFTEGPFGLGTPQGGDEPGGPS